MEGWMDQSSTEKWWGAWGFQRRASVFAAKGIWYRISGQAILYLSALPSERVLHSTGSLLRAADASGEEVEKFRISSSTNGGMRRTFRFWGSDSGYGICWKDSCSPLAFSPPRKGHAWIPGVVLVRTLQKRCTEPGVGDRCISDASETREVLDRNLAIHRCKQSLAQASWYWFVCLENVMDAWWEISELKEISTVPKVYVVLWDSIDRLITYGPSKLIFPGVLSFYIF